MTKGKCLSDYAIAGIGSIIRDLRLLSDDPLKLERKITSGATELPAGLFRPSLHVAQPNKPARVGDLVLFQMKNSNMAFPHMETIWGGKCFLDEHRYYIGVLCERSSSKFFTAQFIHPIRLDSENDFQLVAQAGGIGFATGCSPQVETESGHKVASDVKVIGAITDRERGGATVNIDQILGCFSWVTPTGSVPTILCLGTSTNVGKSTMVAGLARSISRQARIVGIKASGTAGWEDSQIHIDGGADISFGATMVGLPTTYRMKDKTYQERAAQMMALAACPDAIPDVLRPPHLRGQSLSIPDFRIVEHGGDLIEAGIPAYLRSADLMRTVSKIIVCSESAVSLIGALSLLRTWLAEAQTTPEIFCSMPLSNPEGFFNRIRHLLDNGSLAGIIDPSKPVLPDARDRRLRYTINYDRILSANDFAKTLVS